MFPSQLLRKCWFLAGPTASGKTATALALSERIHAEIVSMDSMAIYRHMDIGTAKPTPEEQAVARHHLIDVVDPHQEYSVVEYLAAAQQACEQIVQRGRAPLFVGGTGLYLRSLLRGVFQGPEADWELRAELQQLSNTAGRQALHAELDRVDPESAAKLHPNDERRVIRAIEVFRLTGQPLSSQQQQTPLPESDRPAAVFWLHPPREWLYERINRRVDLMMDQGLLSETQQLLEMTPPPGRTARQGLGYRELIDFIDDRISLEEAVESIKTGTRQFAKRQHTWFRNLSEACAVSVTGEETPGQLAEQLQQHSVAI